MRKEEMETWVLCIIIYGVLGFIGVSLIYGYANAFVVALDTPTVYLDAETGRCVAIEDNHGLHPCGQEVGRYVAQPVQSGLTFAQLRDSRQK